MGEGVGRGDNSGNSLLNEIQTVVLFSVLALTNYISYYGFVRLTWLNLSTQSNITFLFFFSFTLNIVKLSAKYLPLIVNLVSLTVHT